MTPFVGKQLGERFSHVSKAEYPSDSGRMIVGNVVLPKAASCAFPPPWTPD